MIIRKHLFPRVSFTQTHHRRCCCHLDRMLHEMKFTWRHEGAAHSKIHHPTSPGERQRSATFRFMAGEHGSIGEDETAIEEPCWWFQPSTYLVSAEYGPAAPLNLPISSQNIPWKRKGSTLVQLHSPMDIKSMLYSLIIF